MATTAEMHKTVTQLYVALFGRAPDAEGLNFWTARLQGGDNAAGIANTMFITEPARAFYPAGATGQQVITAFYTHVLGREPDAQGLAFWTAELAKPGADPGKLLQAMMDVVNTWQPSGNAQLDALGQASKALFANRVTVANYYAEKGGDVAHAAQVLATVTAQPQSVAQAESAIDVLLNPAPPASDPDPTPAPTPTPSPTPAPTSPPTGTFQVDEANNVVSFSGTATGPITVTEAGGVATFTRGGVTATHTVNAIGTKTFNIAAGQELELTGNLVELSPTSPFQGATFSGNGQLTVPAPVNIASLNTLHFAPGSSVNFVRTVGDTVAHLLSDQGATVSGNVPVLIMDSASLTEIATIRGYTTGAVSPYGGIHDLAASLAASPLVTGSVRVTLDNSGTLADLATIDAKTTGTMTYTGISDTIGNLRNDTTYIRGAVNVTSQDTPTVPEVLALKAKTTGTIYYLGLSGTNAELAANLNLVRDGVEVGFSSPASIATLDQVVARSHAAVFYAIVNDSGANLAGDTTWITPQKGVTVSGGASIVELQQISAKHPSSLSFGQVSDTPANLVADAATAIPWITGKHVQFTGSVAPTLADLAAVDAKTTGVLFYNKVQGQLADLLADTTYVHGGVNVDVTDDGVQLTAANLITLKGMAPQGTVSLLGTVQVNGSPSEILALDSGRFVPGTAIAPLALTSAGTLDMSGVHINLRLTDSPGADILIGGSGDDRLTSLVGADRLTGGAGQDLFRFPGYATNLGALSQITDFEPGKDHLFWNAITPVASDYSTVVVQADDTSTLSNFLDAAAGLNTVNGGTIVFLYQGDAYVYVESAGSGATYAGGDFLVKLTGGAGLHAGDAFGGLFS